MKTRLAAALMAALILSSCAGKPSGNLPVKELSAKSSVNIIINEICAKNKSVLKDSSGAFPDWVEIYNPGSEDVNLKGYGLSDDPEEPLKWKFPSVSIKSKGYLLVFCSGKNKTSGELHANFKISGDGEAIVLSDSSGKKISSIVLPKLNDDETYGYDKNGRLAILTATPGASNSGSSSSKEVPLQAPIFSKQSGFYSSAFNLTLTAPDGCTVYYTTDGSVPTKKSAKYSSPISIKDRSSEKAVLTYKRGTIVSSDPEQFPKKEFEKATVIRAISVDKDGKISGTATATYFIGKQLAEKYKNVSVISVVSDPSGLYSSSNGIFVAGNVYSKWRKENPSEPLDGNSQANYNQRGKEWEREAHIDLFRNGTLAFSENVGMRTHGGWSRDSQQKSLKFYFREEYGDKKLEYELFKGNTDYLDGGKITEYKRFMIRNGGNDSFSLLYKDPWSQSLVKQFPFATQDDDLAICFVDGEYWGLYTMMEVYDNHYIEENYGIDSSDAVMVKAGSLEEGEEEDFKLWEDARNFIERNDMSKAENYEKACGYFDMDSLSEYIAYELYIGNEDWLWNNWAAFRSRTVAEGNKYADGKWRFMLYDTEYSMDLYGNGANTGYDIFGSLSGGDGHLGPMFKSLLKSDEFKKRFVLACEDVMNIAFNPSSAAKALDSYHEKYAPYISQHFERFVFWQSLWGIENNRDGWKKWLNNRPSAFISQMNKYLSTGGVEKTRTLTVNVSGKGRILVNKIPVVITNSKWSGKYFGGYKISVEAVPNSGYEFSGWSGDFKGKSAKLSIDPRDNLNLTATFTAKK